MKKHSAAVALLAFAALLLSSCSAGPTDDGDRSITFMGWGSPEEVAVFEDMIAQYEEEYPGVTVDYVSVPAEDFATKLQTMIASKQTPDVFYLQPEKVMPYADAGLIADLSDYVADNEVFDADNVWEKAIDMYRFDGTTPGEGAIYGLPKDIGPFALAYNKDLFDSAGITAPTDENPWTWDEFVAAARALTSGSGADKVYGSTPFSVESAVWSNGADWLNADHTEVTVTDPQFVEALQWVADLNLVEGVVPSPEEQSALGDYQRFVDGKVGMMGIGPWNQGGLWNDATFAWDLMPWPVSPNTGDEAIWYGGIGFAVANSSEHVEDAENLAAFLAFNEGAQRTNIEKGQAIPNLIDMTENEYLTSDKAPANKAEFIRIITDYGRRATQTYTFNSDWFGLFNSNVASVWNGEMTAAEYTASIEEEMQALLDEGIAAQGE
ncbi:MAG: sugar ABC transporter substrate-binding protein [Microbacterium hominis]|jgi:multiple sugar transport system substrate-binding protein|uniref:ABC transporter substrate-binding protein n=1 Tax=Microbacterium aurum TaxID=36805 RepID=UPI000DB55279|nr:sugar ABC transporter substrate-binding protein [Microbacterium aurum]MBZ6372745.1 sugar ABC transporter substrate-binding protein [Microbacterium hominis]PZU43565.1 MAG: ABC transporter substrate-binding protein [Microbacterium sp.]